MGLQSSPLGHARGASTARTIVPKQAKRAGHAGTRPLAYLGAPPPVFCAGIGEQKAPPDRRAPSLALWRPMSWSPWRLAGRGARDGRALWVGPGLTRLKGRNRIFLWKIGAQKGRPFKKFSLLVLPCFQGKKENAQSMLAFDHPYPEATICRL